MEKKMKGREITRSKPILFLLLNSACLKTRRGQCESTKKRQAKSKGCLGMMRRWE
uniref:Uncharacterized protein n=1 Tax=Arundo donax TaxID=35708 RepID=A0A0A9A9Z1_ARUDO